MYNLPYSKKEILENYPEDVANTLLSDFAHLWRAENGIELIHKEPTKKELVRIWNNWNEMPDDMKEKSDKESYKLFGKNNKEHYNELINNY